MGRLSDYWLAYRLRWLRRKLLARAFFKRRQLSNISNNRPELKAGDILLFACLRNECIRLPYLLEYYRNLGVDYFFFVDNDSSDATREYLCQQPDVSLWGATQSYKKSRFGVDWLGWLRIKFAHGHWCLTVDADEILVYSNCDSKNLRTLTGELDRANLRSFGALMLDMYPKGKLSESKYVPGQNPTEIAGWFDDQNLTKTYQPRLQNMWIQGGVRARIFFSSKPERAPTLNKTPLVKWDRRFAYVSSTHTLLPRALNHVFEQSEPRCATGALLHTKFLHMVVEKSAAEKARREHFANSRLYDDYYDALIRDPDLWWNGSVRYTGWQQLLEMGLISDG